MAEWLRRVPPRLVVAGQAIALLVAVLLLAWAADAGGRLAAQTLVARNIAQATGVIDPPRVRLGGGLLLPQVVRGSYDEVEVDVRGVTSGPLRIDLIEARLTGVRVPFHDVLVRDIGAVGVVSSEARVRLTYADLNYYLEQTGRPLRIALGTDGTVRLTGSVDVLGRSIDAGADVALTPSEGSLRIAPESIDTGTTLLDTAGRLLLRQRLTLTVPLGSLPFGQQVRTVTATPEALLLETAGYGVVVGS